MQNDDFIFIGILGKTIGTQGVISIVPWSSFPERYEQLPEMFLTKEKCVPKKLTVEQIVKNGKKIGVKFAGVESIEEAEKLCGYRITIKQEQKFTLPEGYYYIDDLKECQVESSEGLPLGPVKDVLEMPANDIYVIDYRGQDLLIPAIGQFVESVDIEKRKIVVKLIEGLLPDES